MDGRSGGLEQGMSIAEILRHSPESGANTIYAFRPEQRWLVTDDWVGALRRMDSLDGKSGAPPVPHLAAVRWHNYHMPNQGIGYPRPNPDGSLSDAQRQYITSVDWIHRLAQEIDPQTIARFPESEAAERHESTFDFLREHDPDFLRDLDLTSRLLEQYDPDSHNLLFTLTEDAYQQLDTPRKKLAAFLLLRTRVSDLLPGVIEELRAIQEVDEVTDLTSLYRLTKRRGGVRPVVDTFLSSPMGEGRTTLEFLEQIYHDPLFTNTNANMVGDSNRIRDRFVSRAESTIQAEIARENALMPPPELPDLDQARLLTYTQHALEAVAAQLSDPTDLQVNLASQRVLFEAMTTLPLAEDQITSAQQAIAAVNHVQERLDIQKRLEAERPEPLTPVRRRRLEREIQLSIARRRVLDFSVTEYEPLYNANQGDNDAQGAIRVLTNDDRWYDTEREAIQKFTTVLEQFLGQATPDGVAKLIQAFDQFPEDERGKLFQGRVASGGHHYLSAEGKNNPLISFMLNRDLVLSFMQWTKEEFRPEKGRGNLKNILKGLSDRVNWVENADQKGLKEEVTRLQELLLKAVNNPFIKGYLQLKGSMAGDDTKMAAFRDKKGKALDEKITKTRAVLNAETEYNDRLVQTRSQVKETIANVTERTQAVRESVAAWVNEQEEIRAKLGYKARQWARALIDKASVPDWLRKSVSSMSTRLLGYYQLQWQDLPPEQRRRKLIVNAAVRGAIVGTLISFATEPHLREGVQSFFSALGQQGLQLANQASITPEAAHAATPSVTPTPEVTAQVVATLTPTPTPQATEAVRQVIETVTSTPIPTEEFEHGVGAARILAEQAQAVREIVNHATVQITTNNSNLTLAVRNMAQQLSSICTPNWANPENGVTKLQVLVNQMTDWIKQARGTTVVHIGDKFSLGQIFSENDIRSLLKTCRTNNVFDYIRLIVGR